MRNKPVYTVIDLFSGCGGASLGFIMAGCKVVGAIDVDFVACDTYYRNIGLKPICGDIRAISGDQILKNFGLKKKEVDIVVGCPPCQKYSSLHRTRGNTATKKGEELLFVFGKRVSEIQPLIVVLENVPGLVRYEGGTRFREYVRYLEKLGYVSSYAIVDAADYGVPQYRKRLICISFKTKRKPADLQFSHFKWKIKKTVRNAISDLPPLEPGEVHPRIPNHQARRHALRVLEFIRALPKDGGSRRDVPKRLWLPCHKKLEENGGGAENVYGRMWWDKPAPTMTTRCTTPSSGRFIHPEQDRAITPREAARLQSFPDYFTFPRTFASAERLIGNALPPLLVTNLIIPYIEANSYVL